MTGMPELIAMLHSFVGLAAVLVGWNGYLAVEGNAGTDRIAGTCSASTTSRSFIGVFIGAVTFTGSIVAFLKLSARIKSSAADAAGAQLPQPRRARRVRRADRAWFVVDAEHRGLLARRSRVIALALGWHLVASIGGGDMPVVVSMLNSYSGWAAAAAGFMLGNDLLIVTGALVGSSGAYLSYIMCKAMNRSFISVIAGGFGIEARRRRRQRLRRAPRDRRRGRRRPAARTPVGRHHPRLRHGRRPGAVPGRRADPQAARQGHRRPLRHPPGRRPPARPHERAARRGQGALRHRAGDGRDQRRLPRHRRRARHRRQRHGQPGRGRGPDQPDRRHAGAAGLEGQARRRLQAVDGHRLRRRAEPAVLPGQHARCSSATPRSASRTSSARCDRRLPAVRARLLAPVRRSAAYGEWVRAHGVLSGIPDAGTSDHVCWVYDDDAAFDLAVSEFLAGGLERGEQLLCVGERVIDSLRGQTSPVGDVDALIAGGILRTLTLAEAYEAAGPFAPENQLAYYDAATRSAIKAGYRGLRVIAEVSALAADPAVRPELVRWEHVADDYIARGTGFTAMCAYRAELAGEALADVAVGPPARARP